jgi:hypothetical protein
LELYEENLEGGLHYQGPRRICQVRLWKWVPVSIGAPFWGPLGGRSFPRTFERSVKFIFIKRTLVEEFERLVKEGTGNGQLSP